VAAAVTAAGVLEEEEEEEEEDQARRGKVDEFVIQAAVRAHERLNKRVEADMAVSWVCI